MIKTKYVVADFFAGCGGLSYGFELTGRFAGVLASDVKPEALETYVSNHDSELGRPEAVLEDIRKVTPARVGKMLRRFGVTQPGELDCLIGGPPCEGFSQNRSINSGGKASEGGASRVTRFMDDPRNDLFKWFVELASELKPKVVLIENVPDLVRHKDGATLQEIFEALDRAGYVATARVLNAADYGVPQMRRRTIFLAQRKSDFARTGLRLTFPQPTHKPSPMQHAALEDDAQWLPGESGYWPSVWEAIGDLPSPAGKDSGEVVDAVYPVRAASQLRRFLRTPGGVIYNHIGRRLGKSGLAKVQAISRGQAASDLPEHLKPKATYHYSYARLRWSEPARTITKFCYHVGSGMFAHPVDDRAITIREAARLQSFPDSFRFVSSNIRELSALVGSAVPPLLAKHLATSVAQYLDQLQVADLSPEQRPHVRPQATDAVLRRLHREEWNFEQAESQAPLFGEA